MQQTNWVYDFSHTKIGFSVRHFGITEVDGFFRKFEGSVSCVQEDFSDVQVALRIPIDSIDTNDEQRDAHLKSADFFESEKFPVMTFTSTSLSSVTDRKFKMHGDLTIKGITNPVVLDMEVAGLVPKDPFGNTKAGFFMSGKINRKDWGITWNAALDHGGVAVSDAVVISCQVQLLKVTR